MKAPKLGASIESHCRGKQGIGLRLVLTVLALTAGRATAQAPGAWASSFGQGRAASYLGASPVSSPTVLIAGAGRERAAETAAAALRKALLGAARLVMDSRALGELDDLDDAAIVKRAAALPVDVVVIVRVFGSSSGSNAAVVSFFDKQGQALSAFTVEAGAPLAPRPVDAAGVGVSAEAATAVSAILKDRSAPAADPRSPAQIEYDAKFVGFYETVEAKQTAEVFRSACPYLGVSHAPLCGPGLFSVLGREDLAQSSRRRVTARKAMIGTGAILLVAGTVTAIVGAVINVTSPFCYSSSCMSHDQSPNYVVLGTGIGFLGLGIVGVVSGSMMSPYPIEAPDLYRLARDHNETLRGRLGLPPGEEHVPKS